MAKREKFLNAGQRMLLGKSERGAVILGVDLKDAREEIFVRLVCDGVAMGVAFVKAGFTIGRPDAPSNLFHLPRVQERAAAILEARRSTGVVTLPEVTSMLQRVFAGAMTSEDYSPAHNAAFSLARLYGHVTDRATLEVIRRPSRDPDAPSEQALGDWVASLPALPAPSPQGLAPGPEGLGPAPADMPVQGPADMASQRAFQGPGPAPYGDEPLPNPEISSNINWLQGMSQGPGLGPEGSGPELSNDIKGLGGTPGRPENGAPPRPVTGTPDGGARTKVLGKRGPGPTPGRKKRKLTPRQVPVKKLGAKAIRKKGKIPSMKELFGSDE